MQGDMQGEWISMTEAARVFRVDLRSMRRIVREGLVETREVPVGRRGRVKVYARWQEWERAIRAYRGDDALPPGWWSLAEAAARLGVSREALKKHVQYHRPPAVERRKVRGTWCLCAPADEWRRIVGGTRPPKSAQERAALARRRLAALTPHQRMMLRVFILAVMRGYDIVGLNVALRDMPDDMAAELVGRRAG